MPRTLRGRHKLVENRKDYANKIHGLLTDHGITRKVKPLSVGGREFLEELTLPAPWDTLLETYLEVIETFTDQIERLEVQEELDGTSPEDAFALLGDETRIAIIRALGATPDESLSFSALRERANARLCGDGYPPDSWCAYAGRALKHPGIRRGL